MQKYICNIDYKHEPERKCLIVNFGVGQTLYYYYNISIDDIAKNNAPDCLMNLIRKASILHVQGYYWWGRGSGKLRRKIIEKGIFKNINFFMGQCIRDSESRKMRKELEKAHENKIKSYTLHYGGHYLPWP